MASDNTTDHGSNLQGIGLMLVFVFLMSMVDATIKWMTATYPTEQIVFMRYGFGFLPISIAVLWRGGIKSLKTNRLWGHSLRGVFSVGALFLFASGLEYLPLAETVSLTFIAPLLVTILSIPILKETVGWRRWIAVIVGFCGVLVIVRPGMGVFSQYAFFPMGAALMFSLVIIQTRRLTETETTTGIVFYGTAIAVVTAAIPAINVWVTPSLSDLAVFLTIGIMATVGMLFMTQAFRLAPPAIVTPFEYTALIWATVFGFLVWGEIPDFYSFVGAGIVIASGIYIVHRESLRAAQNRKQRASE